METEASITVGEILSKNQGARQQRTLKIALESGEMDCTIQTSFTGDIDMMRIADGIHVHLTDGYVEVGFTCNRCTEQGEQEVMIPSAERVFYLYPPEEGEERESSGLIRMKDKTIDLTDMLQEEILLHFPLVPVCSNGCKGLCSRCGQNLNQEQCSCIQAVQGELKPLAALKELHKQ